MSDFYYYYELPKIHKEIIECLVSKFKNDGVLTFRFNYSSPGGGGQTLDIGGKAFNNLQDRPIESLEKLRFGEIEYIKDNRMGDYKNSGYFTITKDLLDYSRYINKTKIQQKIDRCIEEIKCNEIPISLGISAFAIVISIISILIK